MSEVIPEKLIFVVEESNQALQGSIVYFVFHSSSKNDFTIGPKVTGNKGEVTLTKRAVEEVITRSQRDFPMDYAGGLSECNALSIVRESKGELKKRIARLKEFYPESAASLEGLVRFCTNGVESACKKIQLPISEGVTRIVIG